MTLLNRAKPLLPAALIGAGVTLFVCAAVQQNYRQSANDPQIQLAQDAAGALDAGAEPIMVVGPAQVNAASSLAPFVTVYDSSLHPLATSGRFDGRTLTPPAG